MNYTHLTISERAKIETYLELGYSIWAIAKRILRQFRESYAAIKTVRLKKHKYAFWEINQTVEPSIS